MAIQQNFPDEGPTLNLNFAGSRTLDPRITFTRTSSATHMGPDGLIKIAAANSPRFDHSYNSATGEIESLGLFVEEARTNYNLNSENTSLGFSGFTNCTISTASTISPTGTQTGDLIVTTSSGSQTDIRVNRTSINGQTTNTFSIFLKYSGTNQFQLLTLRDRDVAVNGVSVEFNILSGTISIPAVNGGTTSGATATIVPYPNGWYRCSISGLVGGTVGVTCITSTRTISGVNASDAGTGCYVWGSQLEAGAFPTSYIPTTASTVTRTADGVSMRDGNFSSWYNPNEGAFFAKARTISSSGTMGIFRAVNSLNTLYRMRISYSGSALNLLIVNLTTQVNINAVFVDVNTNNKVAGSYAVDNFAISANGLAPVISTSGTLPSGIDLLQIGQDGAAATTILNGTISQLTYYPTRLPNNILQTLTR